VQNEINKEVTSERGMCKQGRVGKGTTYKRR